jgi:hypothetical protein
MLLHSFLLFEGEIQDFHFVSQGKCSSWFGPGNGYFAPRFPGNLITERKFTVEIEERGVLKFLFTVELH